MSLDQFLGTGDIFKSVDAGANFVQQDTPVATTLQNVDFPVDATTGWISGAGGVVLKRTGQHMVTGIYAGDGNPTQRGSAMSAGP